MSMSFSKRIALRPSPPDGPSGGGIAARPDQRGSLSDRFPRELLSRREPRVGEIRADSVHAFAEELQILLNWVTAVVAGQPMRFVAERVNVHEQPLRVRGGMDVETLTVNVEMRVVSWLRRHGFFNDDSSEPPADPAARSALEACLPGSLGLGELSALPSSCTRQYSNPTRQ
jgi:hypothetical protein